ncbi:MAG: nitrogen regulation protein NR(I) [Rhodospirillaceae bacterium TMED8]|nr:nitrogen regulation protein NR(I) [Magnetovibrio sp.]OUT52018.1 MAG: nitrogen regulation protein NR(I) [Rhodospirillaceae bacterium TMED8]
MTAPIILLADDDEGIRTVVSQALTQSGFEVRATGNASMLWQWVESGEGDLVITDVIMPDENGLDLIPRIRRIRSNLPVVVMSAQTTLHTAVTATERGAFEYLPKPFDINELVSIVKSGLDQIGASSKVETPEMLEETLPLIGRSVAMQDVYRTLARMMPTDLTVMINGESGTGKELVARALHDYGKRKNGPFVAVNMAAIPRDLIESELFGHEKGAFTGAHARATGRFEQANGGSLFLDEIGDMPPEAQTRLLRVLQEGHFIPVGGQTAVNVDARIIAATHHDLKQLIRQGLFREDLFFRLNVVPIRLPPLRDRTHDIPELVRHFLARAKNAGLPWKSIENDALQTLKRYNWPGNVRELENFVQRLAALYSEEIITIEIVGRELREFGLDSDREQYENDRNGLSNIVERQLASYFAAHQNELPSNGLYNRVLREIEKPLIILTLQATRGNQVRAAEVLGLNRNTLRKKIRDLDIPVIRGGC